MPYRIMTHCKFCGFYYSISSFGTYCSALCREKDENKRLKLMFDIKHTGSEANMMDARKKIEELKSQLKEITDVKNALLEGEVLDGKEIEELKSKINDIHTVTGLRDTVEWANILLYLGQTEDLIIEKSNLCDEISELKAIIKEWEGKE